jgi:hypothetical protein
LTPPIYGPDWTSHHFTDWTRWLGHLAGKPVHGLEIGSFEGRSARWFMETICTDPDSGLTCIDPHSYAVDRELWPEGVDPIAESFDGRATRDRFFHNLGPWIDAGRVVLCPLSSRRAMRGLPQASYDWAYIDGSHCAAAVLEDSVLVWPRLKPGSIIIWDDYAWSSHVEPPAGVPAEVLRPGVAIDSFLRVYGGLYDQLEHSNDQVKIRKIR